MKAFLFVALSLATPAAVSAQSAQESALQQSHPEVFAGREMKPNHDAIFADPEFQKIEKPLVDAAAVSGRATTTIFNAPTHRMLFIAISSKKTPPAEIHPTETDIWVIKSGAGWVLLGGEMKVDRVIPAGTGTHVGEEFAGSTITGGKKFKVKAGDVINIPAKMPHQALLDPGQAMSYYVFKAYEPGVVGK